MGPGLGVGEATCELVLAALAGERAVVLDADALTSFAGEPQRLAQALRARGGSGHDPDPARGRILPLFRSFGRANESSDRNSNGRGLPPRLTGAVVLLKGADTVVAAPDGRASIAANAPAYLATAGAGDVLAGMAAGLLAQGMPAFEAASAAVWLHGEAAAAFGPGLISEDLAGNLAARLPRPARLIAAPSPRRRTVASRDCMAIF